jgi:hypothetical protein
MDRAVRKNDVLDRFRERPSFAGRAELPLAFRHAIEQLKKGRRRMLEARDGRCSCFDREVRRELPAL